MPNDTDKPRSKDTTGIPETKANDAAAAAPDQRSPGENLDHRQDKLLDQALGRDLPQ